VRVCPLTAALPSRHNATAMPARADAPPASRSERARLEPRIKLWVERDGRLVLSDYRVRLLQQIAETGSLAEAAQRMGLSYRRAWGKVREIEQNIGVRLVQSEVGGAGGGGSRLTREGERLVALYQRFHRLMESDLGKEFRDVFKK
jgi:molybdate transport system regulatory protein